MREAVKRFWRINGILGGSAILVTLVVGFGDIGSYVSKLLGNSKPEADVASAVPPDRPPPPVSTASSPPPPPVSRPADLAPKVNPKPRAGPPLRPAFPVNARVDASQARTIEDAGATVSVTFHTVAGEDITTLRVLPRGGDPVSQPFLAAGGIVDFISGEHRYRIQLVAIDRTASAVELIIDRID